MKAFVIAGTDGEIVLELGREVVQRNYRGYAPIDYVARERGVKDLLGLLEQGSLLDAGSFIWLRDGESLSAREFETLRVALAVEPAQGLLVTATEKKANLQRWRQLEGPPHVRVRVVEAKDSGFVEASLVKRAAAQGVQLSPAAARELLARAESYGRAVRELDKLLSYHYGKDAVTLADVQAFVQLEPRSGMFDYVDAFLRRDFVASLSHLERLLAAGEKPDAAFHVLLSMFGSFVRAATMFKIGQREKEVAQALGIFEWQARKYRDFARSWSWTEMVEAQWRLLRADAALKSGEARDVAVLLKKTILSLPRPASV